MVTGRLAMGATWQRTPGKEKGSVAVAFDLFREVRV